MMTNLIVYFKLVGEELKHLKLDRLRVVDHRVQWGHLLMRVIVLNSVLVNLIAKFLLVLNKPCDVLNAQESQGFLVFPLRTWVKNIIDLLDFKFEVQNLLFALVFLEAYIDSVIFIIGVFIILGHLRRL
tara:strand:- start:1263 stop:1649 length:387 start_codon:yes stop_codon:yes gene_type:complete